MEVRGFKRFNNQPIDKGVIMKKSISVVFALSFLISFPVSALEEPYRRRCSIWINGSRAYVLSCIGSRDESGRVNHLEWDTKGIGGGYYSRHPRNRTITGGWERGRTKDCIVNTEDKYRFNTIYAVCLYDEDARERYQKGLQRDEKVRSHLQSCSAKQDYTLYKNSSLREATVFRVQSGVTLYIVRSHRNYMNQPKTVNGNTPVIFSMGGENVWGWVPGSNPCK